MQKVNKNYGLIGLVLLFLFISFKFFKVSTVWSLVAISWVKYGMEWTVYSSLILGVLLFLPQVKGQGKARYREQVRGIAFNGGVIYIVSNIVLGVIQGFGKSPYDHSLLGILLNVVSLILYLMAREMIRAYLLRIYKAEKKGLIISIVILVMVLIEVNWLKVGSTVTVKDWTILIAETLLPLICEHLFATYLVLLGDVKSSMSYLLLVKGFEWLMPVLPDLNWLAKGVMGMTIPILGTVYVNYAYEKMTKTIKQYKEKQESIWGWIPICIVSVGLIWFTAGVFSVYPSAIATGSMEPLIMPGDVILVEKIVKVEQLEALQVGEIIQFRRDNILITHRIKEVIEEDGAKCFRTKGDNNSAEDAQLVKLEAVKGKVVKIIPKIGWPTLLFKSTAPEVKSQVEF